MKVTSDRGTVAISTAIPILLLLLLPIIIGRQSRRNNLLEARLADRELGNRPHDIPPGVADGHLTPTLGRGGERADAVREVLDVRGAAGLERRVGHVREGAQVLDEALAGVAARLLRRRRVGVQGADVEGGLGVERDEDAREVGEDRLDEAGARAAGGEPRDGARPRPRVPDRVPGPVDLAQPGALLLVLGAGALEHGPDAVEQGQVGVRVRQGPQPGEL